MEFFGKQHIEISQIYHGKNANVSGYRLLPSPSNKQQLFHSFLRLPCAIVVVDVVGVDVVVVLLFLLLFLLSTFLILLLIPETYH